MTGQPDEPDLSAADIAEALDVMGTQLQTEVWCRHSPPRDLLEALRDGKHHEPVLLSTESIGEPLTDDSTLNVKAGWLRRLLREAGYEQKT